MHWYFSPTTGIRAWFWKIIHATTMAEEGKTKIEKFNRENFSFWKIQIEDYLFQKYLYQPLEGKKSEDIKDANWTILDRKALGTIRLTLSSSVAFNISKENDIRFDGCVIQDV